MMLIKITSKNGTFNYAEGFEKLTHCVIPHTDAESQRGLISIKRDPYEILKQVQD